MDIVIRGLVFLTGFVVVSLTVFSALSTFVLTRAARSQLNRVVFGIMRRIFEFILKFFPTYEQRDQIMAYYSPLSLMMLVPTWYFLIMSGLFFFMKYFVPLNSRVRVAEMKNIFLFSLFNANKIN